MRIRNLLLIHSGRSTRALIKKYIYAELCDTKITEAESGEKALAQIEANRFDVIISSEQLNDMALEAFATQLEAIRPNGRAAMIVMTDNETAKGREELLQQGFDKIAQMRVRPADLIRQINVVCDPRKWRKDARYHIPDSAVSVSSPNQQMEAALINISMGGVLVELTTDDPCALMNGGLSLSLKIPLPGTTARIDALSTKLLRIETVTWTAGHIPRTMRATFIFVGLNPGTQGKLEELIHMAKEEKLAATEVLV